MKTVRFIVLLFVLNGIEAQERNLSETTDELVDFVNPLVGTDSAFELSNGNTYPAIATPWGMNFGRLKQAKWEMVGVILTMPIK